MIAPSFFTTVVKSGTYLVWYTYAGEGVVGYAYLNLETAEALAAAIIALAVFVWSGVFDETVIQDLIYAFASNGDSNSGVEIAKSALPQWEYIGSRTDGTVYKTGDGALVLMDNYGNISNMAYSST